MESARALEKWTNLIRTDMVVATIEKREDLFLQTARATEVKE